MIFVHIVSIFVVLGLEGNSVLLSGRLGQFWWTIRLAKDVLIEDLRGFMVARCRWTTVVEQVATKQDEIDAQIISRLQHFVERPERVVTNDWIKLLVPQVIVCRD